MQPIKKYTSAMAFTALCLIWSSTWLVLKLGLFSLPPFLAAAIRFFMAGVILLSYLVLTGTAVPMSLRAHRFYLIFGLLNFSGGYAFVYWGQQYIPSGLGSVLFSVMPFYLMILVVYLLPEERITWRKFIGIALGFAGVVVIFHDHLTLSFSHPMSLFGMIAVVTAPVFSSLGTIQGKKARRSWHPVVLVAVPMVYAAIIFGVLSLIFERQAVPVFDFKAIFSLVYLSVIGTAIAFFLYFWMLKNTSAVLMSMITFITPPVALIWGWLVLDETITPALAIGMILIFTGIFIVKNKQVPAKP